MSIKANIQAADLDQGLLQGFATFLDATNVMEFAVGSILGAQFKNIIDSFVKLILSPVVTRITSNTGTLEDMYFVLGDPNAKQKYANWQQAQARGANVVRYGAFLQAVINLLIQIWIVFILVRTWLRVKHTLLNK